MEKEIVGERASRREEKENEKKIIRGRWKKK